MSNEDSELERLKAKRLAEMQKNISSQQKIEESTKTISEKPIENPRTLLVGKLGYRGLEVLENAESQFPNETKIIVSKLSELIKTGEINEILDGGKLLALFRTVGLSIRMKTKINVEQDGKLVSLSDKFSNQSSDISDDK
ncbi:MAG: double-stranded DNA-binding protein [Nitrosopumilus sp.]|nr:DNA-binding protein [Nitrosopumilus sp.]NRA05895.1 double-stranded DNA-binding protein [Nitrosopumilus sp.]